MGRGRSDRGRWGRGRSDRGRVWPAVAVALVVALVTPAPAVAGRGLARPRKKEVAQILVSTAENSSRDWRAQYRYIEYNVEHNAEENRGYTGGIIGFTSRTGDMLAVVRRYCRTDPGNLLAPYLPALIKVNGTPSREGLGPEFVRAWRRSAEDPGFRRAQDHFRDAWYFTPQFVALAATACTPWVSSPTTTRQSCTVTTACSWSGGSPCGMRQPRRRAVASSAIWRRSWQPGSG